MPIIDHVGIAVKSLHEAIPRYQALWGAEPHIESVPEEGVRVAIFGDGAGRVELLEPLGDDSPIGRFLSKRGSGIHHVCIRVDDLEGALSAGEARGLDVIPPRIRTGAGGHRVAFLHPGSTGGVLLELSEATPAGELRGG